MYLMTHRNKISKHNFQTPTRRVYELEKEVPQIATVAQL